MNSVATWPELEDDVLPERLLGSQIATEPRVAPDPAWEKCIDALLGVREQPPDDGLIVPPNRAAIDAALRWITYWRVVSPHEPPSLITAEPGGGILIEWSDSKVPAQGRTRELTCYNSGLAEFTAYDRGRVVAMFPVSYHPPRGS